MQWPRYETVRKVMGMTIAFVCFVAAVWYINYETPEEKAIREWAGWTRPNLWWVYLSMAAGVVAVYILLFKVEETRQRRIAVPFAALILIGLFLLPDFWLKGFLALAFILAIVLVGWLYPARDSGGGQT